MNKKINHLLLATTITMSSATIVATIASLSSCSCSYHSSLESKKVVLSSQSVTNNFKDNGVWANKKFITSQDLQQYDAIAINAFDNINVQLDYIEIDENKQLTDSNGNEIYNIENPFIKWDNVNEIRIVNKSVQDKDKKFISYSGLIYFRVTSTGYQPVSLSSKTQQIDIVFPTDYNKEFGSYGLRIPDNFYQTFNCKNTIKSITLKSSSEQEYNSLINIIGSYAFSGYKFSNTVLDLTWNFNLKMLSIYDSAFENCNLTEIKIDGFSSVLIYKNAFKGNLNLKKVVINTFYIGAYNGCFSNCNPDFSFAVLPSLSSFPYLLLDFGSNIFSNSQQYTSFKFDFVITTNIATTVDFKFKLDSLSNINLSNVNNFVINEYCLLRDQNETLSDFNNISNQLRNQFARSGLKQEYLNNFKPIAFPIYEY